MLAYVVCNIIQWKKLGVTVLLFDLRSIIYHFWVNFIRECCHSNVTLVTKTALIKNQMLKYMNNSTQAYLKLTVRKIKMSSKLQLTLFKTVSSHLNDNVSTNIDQVYKSDQRLQSQNSPEHNPDPHLVRYYL